LLLVWRDRRLDTRAVGGPAVGPLTFDLPLTCRPAPAARLAPRGCSTHRPTAGDRRAVVLDEFDLTAAVLLTPAADPPLAAAIEQELPRTARRSLVIAAERWQQVAETIQALEAHDASAGGRPLMAIAAGLLDEAQTAFRHGYLRSSIERAWQADGAVREAQASELEAALTHRLADARAAALRLSFPGLPGLFETRDRLPTGPYPLAAGTPLRIDFATAGVGSRWTAWPGFDQTVATLSVASQALRWQPTVGDPGALYLPFEPQREVTVALRAQVDALTRERIVGCAEAVYAPAVAGLRWLPDGTVRGPQGSARWAAGQWHRLAWRASAGRVAVSFDDLSLGSVAVTGPLAALVLAVTADPGEEVMSLDDVEITVPQ